jgi:hypothetical protein
MEKPASDAVKLSLSDQVRECLDAGNMTLNEGAEYTGIYSGAYQVIAGLIRISRFHSDPDVKSRAASYLVEFDRRGQIGRSFQEALRFVSTNKVRVKMPRKKIERGRHRINSSEKRRVEDLASRSDVADEDRSEAKRIAASVVDDKIASADYAKLIKFTHKYSNGHLQPRQVRAGWRKVSDKSLGEFQSFLARPDVGDADKRELSRLIDGGVEEKRMKVADYIGAVRIVTANKANKRERARKVEASTTFENALFMACQACDNLDFDDARPLVFSELIRAKLVARIARAAVKLLRLQSQLAQEEE